MNLLALLITAVAVLPAGLCLLVDPSRGLKVAGISPEEQQQFIDLHSPQRQNERWREVDELKSHPEFQRLQEWKSQLQRGDRAAGAAFTGRIPHDLVHLMVQQKPHDLDDSTMVHHAPHPHPEQQQQQHQQQQQLQQGSAHPHPHVQHS